MSNYAAVTADGKISFQKFVDVNTPYITAMTGTEIHVVKQELATDAEKAASATGDAISKLPYNATAIDTLCVKFADKQYIQLKISAGIWVRKGTSIDENQL